MYAYDVNLWDESINATEENRETLFHSGKKVDFEVKAQETVCMLMYRHLNARQYHSI
jgi:hypothetical protein